MGRPTLLFVEEYENTLSRSVVSNKTISLVLIRFKQNMFFSQTHLNTTSNIPCFVYDKAESVEHEVEEFRKFCTKNEIVVDYFYNDSEYNQEVIQKFASQLELPGAVNEYQARCVRDKAAMKDKLQELGYRTMLYQELTSLDDALEFAEKNEGFPFIVKWRRGLSSKEVYKIESKSQLESLQLDYSTGRFIAETYCPYLIWSFDSLVQDGKVVGTFLTWLPYTNLSFAEKKEKFAQITVAEHPKNIRFDGVKITQNVVSGLGLKNGYIEIEFFVDLQGQPIICEFAWRTPGDHMLSNQSLAFGVDVCSLLVDIMVGRKIQSLPLNGQQCVGDMFLPLTNGVVTKISSYPDISGLAGVIDGNITCKVGDVIESKRQYTSCAGWVQITGQTADEVLSRMLKVYEKFEIVTVQAT
ncbi:MAG: ATP-grasp domain-containing protein [Candidatus Vogelbacteria bacterium]|nr:ATP-grasp domain-containing protein [Candidatus Vogelbacteria bacterium]